MPKITDLASLTTPQDTFPIAIVDTTSGTTKKITRGDFLKGAALPSNTVTTGAIASSAVTSDKIATDSLVIGYVESATGQNTTSSTYVDYTTGTITFTTPASCTKIVLKAELSISNTDGAASNFIAITNGSGTVQIERSLQTGQSNANAITNISLTRRITVTPSTSYTFKLMFRTTSGTSVINQGGVSTTPTILMAERA